MKNYCSIQLLRMINSFWITLKQIPLSMKLFIICLICSVSITWATEAYAQQAMISIDVRNQTVGEILKEIESQSDFDFFSTINMLIWNVVFLYLLIIVISFKY